MCVGVGEVVWSDLFFPSRGRLVGEGWGEKKR